MDTRQRIAIGALGLGYVAVRCVASDGTRLHERVASDADLLAWNRSLSASLSELFRVAPCGARLMALVHEFREQDQRATRTSSFHMNRLMGAISTELQHIVRNGSRSLSAADLRENVYAEQDVVPAIRSHLESILHNHMLRTLM